MTNAEKFQEVFGFPPGDNRKCIVPMAICNDFDTCRKCPFLNWWDKEYLPCFSLKKMDEKDIKEKNK